MTNRGEVILIPTKGENPRLVVPIEWRNEILELCHDIPSAGHQGAERTREKIKQSYYWHGLGADVERYVASCKHCSQNKKATRSARCPQTLYHSGYPMERVHLDFIGPLPKTERGNENVLMMVDQFSKWVECVPLPSQTAEVTARAAVNEFFCRFGYPFEIFTDQGRNFESQLFRAVCELLHIHKARTTPYRPCANGQVERFNRTLMAAVRCFVGTTQRAWDENIAQLAGAIRASVNRTTGFTANKLMLGREVNTPAELMFRPPRDGSPPDLDGYVAELVEAMQAAHEVARLNIKTSQLRSKRDYDLRVNLRQYNVGDLVYQLDTATTPGKCKKLCPVWKGPGIVFQRVSAYLYKVKMKKSLVTANHDRLKICKDRVLPPWLVKEKKRLEQGNEGVEKNTLDNPEQNPKQSPKQTQDDNPPAPDPLQDSDAGQGGEGTEICRPAQSIEGKPSGVHNFEPDLLSSQEEMYCICRGPDIGDFMIGCDGCTEWFHGRCVGISPQDGEELGEYLCKTCKEVQVTKGVTSTPIKLRRSVRNRRPTKE
ncbi:COMPASS component SPP1 [Mytilus galloprovincialis]|uniref:COMPASS component SPP1 n=1 Tax=Mytilus galloprovincialis TaxID=29158 RepID=A0A8B6DIH2_MYTGA|nr:COMPASS component SPP1 [Mytilus galloprovincialis]